MSSTKRQRVRSVLDMDEDGLKKTVLDMCQHLRLLVVHFKPALLPNGRWVTAFEGDAGFPDLVIVGHAVMFRELKSATGRVEKPQKLWLDRIHCADGDSGVWRPEDLQSGLIESELKWCAGKVSS